MSPNAAAAPESAPGTLLDQLALVISVSNNIHGPHREVDDGTADIVCGCEAFRATYTPDEKPGARGRAIDAHRNEMLARAVLTLLGAAEPSYPVTGSAEMTDDEWWAYLIHSTPVERAARIRQIRERMAEAARCFMQNHENRIATLEARAAERGP